MRKSFAPSPAVCVALVVAIVGSGAGATAKVARDLAQRAAHSVGTGSVLYSFGGASGDGSGPQAGLVADASGALYGTTGAGGDGVGSAGHGTVFKLTPSASGYTERVLHTFRGGTDGAAPWGSLILDSSGALYGTTSAGGGAYGVCAAGCGTVFKLTRSGKHYLERVIYRFQGESDGAKPYYEALLRDATGALYGTTNAGGGDCNCGTVFKLGRSGRKYTESVLYGFRGGSDGAGPESGVIADADGALFGTTYAGGSNHCGGGGCGTAFKLTLSSGGYTEGILHAFTGGVDGGQLFAPLTEDPSGAIYGTTAFGSSHYRGSVFKFTPAGSGYDYSILSQFLDERNSYLVAGVLVDGTGALFGTTSGHFGSVYELTPSRSGYGKSTIYTFKQPVDGVWPDGTLITDGSGALYGTTTNGGAYGYGTVFKVVP